MLGRPGSPGGRGRRTSRPGFGRGATSRPSSWRVTEADEADEILKRHPFLDDLLFKPVTPGRIRLRLDKGARGPPQPSGHHPAQERASPQERRAPRAEQDRRGALRRAGHQQAPGADPRPRAVRSPPPTREASISSCGGRTPTSTDDDQLRFELAQNDSLPAQQFEKKTMPLDEGSIAGIRRRSRGEPVNVADAYDLPEGLDVPDQPRLRPAVGLPDQVRPRGSDEGPPGQGRRRRAAHQQEARSRDRPAARVPGGRGRDPLHLGGRGAGDVAGQPGRGRLREHAPHPGHPEALRVLRPGLRVGHRVTRPHHVGSFQARRDPHRRDRREGGRPRGRPVPRRALHPRPDPGDPLREPPPRLRKGRRSREGPHQGEEAVRGRDAPHPAAHRLHQANAGGRAPPDEARAGDRRTPSSRSFSPRSTATTTCAARRSKTSRG